MFFLLFLQLLQDKSSRLSSSLSSKNSKIIRFQFAAVVRLLSQKSRLFKSLKSSQKVTSTPRPVVQFRPERHPMIP